MGATNSMTIQREPLLTWAPTPPKADHKMDYFVSHFGTDSDVKAVGASISAAETIVGHKFDPDMSDKTPKRNYFVPQFGEDSDIKSTKASASLAETQLNHVWDPEETKDPKRNSFVPNFALTVI